MKVRFKEEPPNPPHVFMRDAGYARKVNHDGDESFVRRISGFEFPRFHVYVQANQLATTALSIHIDQKEHTYEGSSAHSGEYEGAVVEKELLRIRDALQTQLIILTDTHGKPLLR